MIGPKGFIVILLVWLVILTNGCLSATSDYPKFLTSKYEYISEINTDAPLYNATFFIPLPIKDGRPLVGSRPLSSDDFPQEGYTVSFTKSPPSWNPIDIKTREFLIPSNEPWFVQIHADYWPNGSYNIEIVNSSNYLISPTLFVNTLYPVGNESIFLPKLDFSPPIPVKKSKLNPFSDWIEYTNQTTQQSTWIYADYSTDSHTSITVYMRIRGSNYWLDDFDTSVGNHYQDSFSEALKGESHGVFFMTGDFTAGNMIYPDLSSAKWQQFIQKNQQGI